MMRRKFAITAISIVAALLQTAIADAPGTLRKTTGQTIQGMIRWQPASRVYVVRDSSGVAITIPASQVEAVTVSKPAALEPAIQLVQAGKYDAAVADLQKIISDYAMLQWDEVATHWLAISYLNLGKPGDAVTLCENIVRQDPEAAWSGDIRRVYWDALLQSERYSRLRDILSEGEEKGDRTVKGYVQIAYGDIEKQQGNFQEALVKGYLRAIAMYDDVTEIQPEALYKSILCFKALGQTRYAQERLKTLEERYPDNPYTKQAKAAL